MCPGTRWCTSKQLCNIVYRQEVQAIVGGANNSIDETSPEFICVDFGCTKKHAAAADRPGLDPVWSRTGTEIHRNTSIDWAGLSRSSLPSVKHQQGGVHLLAVTDLAMHGHLLVGQGFQGRIFRSCLSSLSILRQNRS